MLSLPVMIDILKTIGWDILEISRENMRYNKDIHFYYNLENLDKKIYLEVFPYIQYVSNKMIMKLKNKKDIVITKINIIDENRKLFGQSVNIILIKN